jgi:hypothetical protein
MGDIVDARACQAFFFQQIDGFVQLTAAVFEVGGGAAHLSDEALEHLGNRVARPGVGHTDPDAVDVMQREGVWSELMVMGIHSQNGSYFTCAQAYTDIDHPDEAVGKGSLAQG